MQCRSTSPVITTKACIRTFHALAEDLIWSLKHWDPKQMGGLDVTTKQF